MTDPADLSDHAPVPFCKGFTCGTLVGSVSATALVFWLAQPVSDPSDPVERKACTANAEHCPSEVVDALPNKHGGEGSKERSNGQRTDLRGGVHRQLVEHRPLLVAAEGERSDAANACERKPRNEFSDIHESLPSVPRTSDGKGARHGESIPAGARETMQVKSAHPSSTGHTARRLGSVHRTGTRLTAGLGTSGQSNQGASST